MTKDRSWMYRNIESSEFIDGVLEFCSIAYLMYIIVLKWLELKTIIKCFKLRAKLRF